MPSNAARSRHAASFMVMARESAPRSVIPPTPSARRPARVPLRAAMEKDEAAPPGQTALEPPVDEKTRLLSERDDKRVKALREEKKRALEAVRKEQNAEIDRAGVRPPPRPALTPRPPCDSPCCFLVVSATCERSHARVAAWPSPPTRRGLALAALSVTLSSLAICESNVHCYLSHDRPSRPRIASGSSSSKRRSSPSSSRATRIPARRPSRASLCSNVHR